MEKEIILLHGDFQNKTVLNPIEEFFKSRGYKTHNLNLPGHGSNTLIQEPNEFLSNYIQENQIEKPLILGHSFGGIVAAKHALHNDDIDALILVNPPLLYLKELDSEKDWEGDRGQARQYNKQLFEGQNEIDYHEIKTQGPEAIQMSGMKTTEPNAMENHYSAYEGIPRDLLDNLDKQTLIIASTNDSMVPLEKAKEMQGELEIQK